MIAYLKSLLHGFSRYRHLLLNLVQRDIKVKYRRSALGMAWSVLNPLLMMMVMTLVFSYLFSQGDMQSVQAVRATGLPPKYPVYLLAGQLMFSFFSEATNLAMDSVLGNAPLIKKVYIPKYIFPLEKVIFSFINSLSSLIALVLVMAFTLSPVSLPVVLFPAVMILLFFFNLGVGLILAALTVFFRDIKHFYGVIVLALNYLTPVFYTEDIFGPREGQLAQFMTVVIRINPLYWYVSMFRRVVVYGYVPTGLQWLLCGSWAVGMLALGLVIFKKAQDKFILYV